MIQAKTTAQNATKLSGIIKWGSASVLHGLKSSVLQLLKRYPSISVFSFAADGHFINYRSLEFWLLDDLIRCRSAIDFKLGHHYSSYLPLLPAHIRQNWLGPTCCCASRHSRSLPKAGALLVHNKCCVELLLHVLIMHKRIEMQEHYILAGCPLSAGFCYGESHNSKSAPASFDVCELVAMEGSCYNDGRV